MQFNISEQYYTENKHYSASTKHTLKFGFYRLLRIDDISVLIVFLVHGCFPGRKWIKRDDCFYNDGT